MTILLLFCLALSSVEHEIDIDLNKLAISYDNEYAKLRLPGYELSDCVGAPEVLVKPLMVAIPCGAHVTDVEIIAQESQELAEKLQLSCVQPPVILSQTDIPYVMPKPEIYESVEPYPKRILELQATTMVDGYSLAEILFYPVQYLPGMKKVRVFTRVRFVVHYEGGSPREARHGMVQKLIVNPGDVRVNNTYSDDGFEYVIITAPPLDTVFERLAAWKTKKGIRTVVRTLSWIKSRYSGEDDAARVRNYLKTAIDSGAVYVLMGGDTDVLPHRRAFAMCCEFGGHPREDSLPCDLYFGDIDGNWDENHNGVYGEVADSINLYPELYVGRAPVSTVSQAQKFVQKVLQYERSPDLTYLDNALFAADILWSNPYTDQGIHKNKIEEESFPANFENTKLYKSLGNLSRDSFLNALRQGKALTNHDGHGSSNSMSVGNGTVTRADFDTLTNDPYYGICISIGCWTTAFDYDAVAEHFVRSPNGGGLAFIGNSSYGWGSPGNPGFGYSDRFDSRFFYSLLKDGNHELGSALSLAKAHFIPYSHEENVYRWHQYQLNLMGDPALCVWTSQPETLLISAPQSISLGASSVLITVRDQAIGQPVRNALVCLMKDNESYAAGYTDASGQVFLAATPSTLGDCALTVTAHNYLPVETTLPVVDGSYISYCGWTVNDSLGNDDTVANPGEHVLLDVTLKNTGDAIATDIELWLHSSDSFVTMHDSAATLAYLLPGDSATIHNAFAMTIGAASNGYGLRFDLEINEWSRSLHYGPIVLIGTPVLHIDDVIITHMPTFAGESESLRVNLHNEGFGFGHMIFAQLSSSDPYVTVLVDSVWYGELEPECLKMGEKQFIVSVDPACPCPHLAVLPLLINTADGAFADTIQLLVGNAGFHDNMESGSGLWTTGGTNNMWHIATERSYSPTQSWYCGDSTTRYYSNSMNCYIQTIPFIVQSNALLKFRRWLDVPLYGSDGIYVIVMGDDFADTLDFIGTGGALAPDEQSRGGIHSEWFEERYSLSAYPAGESIQVKIAFVSDGDGDVGEGFYIDDVCIEQPPEVEPSAPHITSVEKSGNDITITWNKVTTDIVDNPEHTSHYVVYRDSSPSFIPGSSNSIAVVVHPDTVYTDGEVLGSTESYYYLIKTVDWVGNTSAKSNMGYRLSKFVNENATKTDRNWVSLPWHSNYGTVDDLVNDLSPMGDPLCKIVKLRDDKKYESYAWDPEGFWDGVNFAIESGRAYEMIATSDDTIVVVGSNKDDGKVQLKESPTTTDRNWVSIPYNHAYATVSDITTEYCPAGYPVTKITNLRDDQKYESYAWDPEGFWDGIDFAIERGRGYDFITVMDTTWDPTEYSNEAGMLFVRAEKSHGDVRVGTMTQALRSPAWSEEEDRRATISESIQRPMLRRVESQDVRISHIVRAHVDVGEFEDVVFTAYCPERPHDVLTERNIGCGFSLRRGRAALWFDVGNFEIPWQDADELILIIEVLRQNQGYYAVLNCRLDGKVDIQDLGEVVLIPIPEPTANVIGYSVYKDSKRVNDEILSTYESGGGEVVRPVIRGGYETVHSSGCMTYESVNVQYDFAVKPNPFVGSTTIEYSIHEHGMTEIIVYDVAGRAVRTVTRGMQKPGSFTALWDGTDDRARSLPSGVYFIRFAAGTHEFQEKVILFKE